MKPLIKIFIYLFFSLVIGAMVAPVAYWGIALLPADNNGFLSSFLFSIQQMPFHRYLSRSIQVTAFILLWPTIFSLKIERLSDLSLYRNPQAGRDWLVGIVMALFPLWLVEIFFVGEGWYTFNNALSGELLFKIISSAIIVSLVEEFLFRGVLLGLSRRFLKNEAAFFFVTFLFAGVHFLNLPHSNETNIHWWSGFSLMLQGGTLLPWPLALGAFATLFLLGMILGWVTLRTESLWLAIGLHTGWIFAQQIFNTVARYDGASPEIMLPWLAPSQIHGMVPVGILILIPFIITTFFLKQWLQFRLARLRRG